jgi:glycine dehydrogenase subunit 1
MLHTVGVASFEELLAAVPEPVRLRAPLDIADPLAESEVERMAETLAARNAVTPAVLSFLGGGIYDHHVPAAVDHVASRSEYYTAYTPYQAEVAQGTLQVTYEYQSMIRRLTAMDTAQASLYDGGSAVAEAALMAMAHTGQRGVVFAGALNPRYRSVVETYLTAQSVEMKSAIADDGRCDFGLLNDAVGPDTSCVIMQSPNYFGMIDDWARASEVAHGHGALMIAVFHPISLGQLKPPGECGADIAVGEGQMLGNPPSFGGPLLGLFATRREFIRRIPGRLVGRTVDARGATAYVMTLRTREQDIRREKATSNICTAQALLATRAAITMALLGKVGITKLATTCSERAHYLASHIDAIESFRVPFGADFFNEFVVESDRPARDVLMSLRKRGIQAGIELGGRFPGFERRFLVCVSEKHTRADLDRFVSELSQMSAHPGARVGRAQSSHNV